MNRNILIVDDDKKISDLIQFELKRLNYAAHAVYSGGEALEHLKRNGTGLILLDMKLKDMDGLKLLKEIKRLHSQIYVIMVSAYGDIRKAVTSIQLGAYDFIEKPFEIDDLTAKVKRVFDRHEAEDQPLDIKRELGDKYKFKSIIGNSQAMRRIMQRLELAARSSVNVLLSGESGTGKELIARAIHFNSAQKDGPFVTVNCGAIPENLLESELFGHEKGSFTGAMARKIGKFEQAQNGTIFLDEIAELPHHLQVKLLRVLQEREIERVGGNQYIEINARFISATNRDLKQLIQEKGFREDLFFRVNVFPIALPPLRERPEDIPELLTYFIKKHQQSGRPAVRVDSKAIEKLMEYPWPGNVRELENFVERMLLLKSGSEVVMVEDILSFDDFLELPGPSAPSKPVQTLSDAEKVTSDTERIVMENALKKVNGNISEASKILNISRDTFYRKMKKYAIKR